MRKLLFGRRRVVSRFQTENLFSSDAKEFAMKCSVVKLLVAAGLLAAAGPLAAEGPVLKEMVVVNTESANMLRVEVDHANHFYKVGETMTVTVKPEKSCYLYLLYYGAGGKVACLFPNQYQQDNFVQGGATVQVPAADAKFQITCRPPCGRELLLALGTEKPMEALPQKQMTKGPITLVEQATRKEMVAEMKQTPRRDWAEARIEIRSGEQAEERTSRRVAVCVGISQFQSERVPPLRVSDKDARRMAAALKDEGRCEEVILLTNAEATYAAIEKAIFKDLPQKTRPGDSVLLYFSLHGGRCADTTGEKADGLRKFLVPYDGVPGQPETMIMDSTFTRWIRELDGREIGIILDNCYAGGIAKGRGRAKGIGGASAKGLSSDVFLTKELRRAKALGQEGVMLLAACEGHQLAWEMEDEDGDSVLTYQVLKALKDPKADANGDGHITVGELFSYAKEPVKEYVQKTFGAEQDLVLVNLADDKVLVKP
jgi:hypothetical protein